MFDWIERTIARLGYWGVAGLTFLENIVPPIPSEVVVPMAGYVAAKGSLDFWWVVAAGAAGALAGAAGWFRVARAIGDRRLRAWVDAHGHWITLECDDIDKAQRWFDAHGPWAVLIGRLVPGVRTFISVPAGFSSMGGATFLIYTAIGTLLWTLALAWAGTVLQSNFDKAGDSIDVVSNVLLAAFLVYLAYRYVRVFRRRAVR